MSLRIRRGTESQRQSSTFDLGEIVYTTDGKKLFVGDGVTVGGVNVLKTSVGAGLSWNDSSQQLEISGTNLSTSNIIEGTNLYFTTDRAQDAAASLFTHNVGHNNISFTYDDTLNKILATVSLDGVGIASVSADPSPSLGGNLILNTHNITGTGGIDITGNITATTINAKLGSDLVLNSKNITGTGNINISGSINSNSVSTGNINSNSLSTGSVSIAGNYISMSNDLSLHLRTLRTRQFSVVDGSMLNMGYIDVAACKNSIATPAALSAEDYIGTFAFSAYYNDEYRVVGALTAQLDSTPTQTPTGLSGNMYISVSSENIVGNRAIYQFSSSGTFSAPVVQPGVYATSQERDLVITIPTPGMIVYLTDISKFTGYVDDDGSSTPGWVNLH